MMNPIQLFTWGKPTDVFISTWNTQTTSTGSTAVKTIKLPLITAVNGGNYNFWVDWGDGTPKVNVTTADYLTTATHVYAGPATTTPTIRITGTIVGWQFNSTGDRNKITSILKWGCLRLSPLVVNVFQACQVLQMSNATDVPVLTGVTNLTYLFGGVSADNTVMSSIGRFTDWKFQPGTILTQMLSSMTNFNMDMNALDVSNVIALNSMFRDNTDINSPLDTWNVSGVTVFDNMFTNAIAFNQNINNWNISNGTTFINMFSGATSFNQPINNWHFSSASSGGIVNLLNGASSFNQNLDNLDINSGSANSLSSFLSGATAFNNGYAPDTPPVPWILNTSKITAFGSMLLNCVNFNQNINNWNTANAISLSTMFSGCSKFNSPLDTWNTSKVTTINNLFQGCTVFNQPLVTNGLIWDVSKVTVSSGSMFNGAAAFNKNLNSWNTLNFNSLTTMFNGATNFNNELAPGVPGSFTWVTPKVTSMVSTFQDAVSFNCDISQFDCRLVVDFGSMFNGATSFNNGGQPGIGTWLLNQAAAVQMDLMFNNAIAFNQPLNGWGTVRVAAMNSMFVGATIFNNGLPAGQSGTLQWDTNRVTTMANMFQNCLAFNQNVSGWQLQGLTNTTNLSFMFAGCTSFNQNMNPWVTTTVTNMASIFSGCTIFNNGELPGVSTPGLTWNVTGVTTSMAGMFQNCPAFNQSLSTWDTFDVLSMANMFEGATVFNQPLVASGNIWNTGKVTSMANMFNNAIAFNQDISSWNTGLVTNMSGMFQNAAAFNQNIGNWNTINVTNMSNMFQGATAFDQNIGNWNVSKVANFTNFMADKTPATFSTANLDAIYNGWVSKNLTGAIVGGISFGTAQYTSASFYNRLLMTRPNSNPSISAISNSAGLFRITTSTGHGLPIGSNTYKVYVTGLATHPTAVGLWTVSVIGATTIELLGSTFAGSGTPTGNVRNGFGWIITDGGSGSLTDNIVASYTLNSVLTDSAVVSPTATQVGITYIAGKTGNAAVFNAATDVIDIPDTTALSFTDGSNDISFSINLWVYFTGFSSTGNWLLNKRGGVDADREWQLYYDTVAGRLTMTKYSQGQIANLQTIVATSPFVTGQWYNITITDDGTGTYAGMKMYINEVLQTTTDTSVGTYIRMLNGTSIARIGQVANATGATTAHQGYIEDVSVWKNRVLTQADVTYLWNGGNGRTYPFT